MDRHALDVLEFEKLRELLSRGAASELGLQAARSLAPLEDRHTIELWLARTSEARLLFNDGGDIPLGGLHDLTDALSAAGRGAVLDATSLREVAESLRCAANVRAALSDHSDLDTLTALSDQLIELPYLVGEVHRCIGDDDTILDTASDELRRARAAQRTLSARVQTTLRGVLSQLAAEQAVQDAVVTLRGGRYCIPVKTTHQGRVDGLVHDRSSTGATVFVEPNVVVRLNNELREAQVAEQVEIERILAALSSLVAEHSEALRTDLLVLALFDEVSMRAQLSRRLQATAPDLNEDGEWELIAARHPLLAAQADKRVVASDCRLGLDFDTLLVTGPNTGGKTVALKTLGLLTIMARCGLHVPAEVGTRIALCPDVFADIGDEQSLEQSLSTFSAHLRQIVHILDAAQPGSLVLLDEVGAGTDPAEGAALAQAVLAALHERGCRVMATTHHGSLKAFAYATEGIENASVEFDRATLRPTYRLLVGIPGASHAFDVAAGLGLDASVLSRARELLPAGHVEAADLIGEMQSATRRLAEELRSRQHETANVSHLRRELELERLRLRQLEAELKQRAERDAKAKLDEVSRESERILTSLRQARREGKQTEAARSRLRKLSSKVTTGHGESLPHHAPDSVSTDDEVRLVRLNKVGRVVTTDGRRVTVQIGNLRTTVDLAELELVSSATASATPQAPGARRSTTASVGWSADVELHIRGETVDEALPTVERFIDRALLAGIPQVRIVHGKGTGTLKRVVQEYLRSHPQVASYEHPPEALGGTGVTVATLR